MINPNLGTVLGFLTTDLNISQELLQKTLRNDVIDTYNMLSVDGDTSTNDTVMIFANGMAGNDELLETDADYPAFAEALQGGRKKACKIRGDIKPCKMRRIRFGCELGTSGVRDGTERDRF